MSFLLRIIIHTLFLLLLLAPSALSAQHKLPHSKLQKHAKRLHTADSPESKDTLPQSSSPNNFLLELWTEHQPSDNFVNEQDLDVEINYKKFHLQAGYGFFYDPFSPEGNFTITSKDHSKRRFEIEKRTIFRQHQTYVDIAWELNEKNKLILNHQLTFDHVSRKDETSEIDFQRNIHTRDQSQDFQFSQIWQHTFNSFTNLKIGAIEDYRKIKRTNESQTQEILIDQDIHSKLPGISSFIRLENRNKWGQTTGELRFSHLSGKDEMMNYFPGKTPRHTFHYQENMWSAELYHLFPLSETRQIEMEVGLEKASIQKSLNSPENSPHNSITKKNVLDLTYRFSYTITPSKEESYQWSLERNIDRPTYSQLNPLWKIYEDLIYTAGNMEINPAHHYNLTFQTHQKKWNFEGHLGYSNNFILPYYKMESHHLIATSQNFKNVLTAGAEVGYERRLWNDRWETRNNIRISYHRFEDAPPIQALGNAPQWKISSTQNVDLGHHWSTGLDVIFESSFKNNVLKQYSSAQVDLFIEKKIGKRLKIVIFGEDIFHTNRRWEKFLTKDYSFSRNIYLDLNTYGFSLQYDWEGKNYKHHSIEKPQDRLRKRLP